MRSSSAHKMVDSSDISGTVACFLPPVTKQTGVDSCPATASHTIWKPAHFQEVDK